MNVDPRIRWYRDAALAMQKGEFPRDLPIGGGDELAELGQALLQLGQAVERKFQEWKQLASVTEAINAGLLMDEVLDHVFESFRPMIPYNRIGLALIDEKQGTVWARWSRSDAEQIQIKAGYSAPLKGSSLERIIQTGRPRILNDLREYLKEHPESESTRLIVAEGVRSSLTCPLIAMGKPIGFIFFSSMEPDTYRNVHVELFQQIAGQLSMIIEKGRLYQQLLELSELKNKFLGMAAHDLRNPLGVVKVYMSLLKDGIVGPITAKQLEILEGIDRKCETMRRLVSDLLDVSAIEAGHLELHPQPVQLEVFLRECQADNQLLAHYKSIEIALEVEAGLPLLSMDPERIAQVVNNLVSNAVKFSPKSARVTIGARRRDQAIEVYVDDQGLGIPADELRLIFQDYGKTSVRPTGSESSTGLGLAIVKRIVEAHGGTVAVQSAPDRGSCFSFLLPLEAFSASDET